MKWIETLELRSTSPNLTREIDLDVFFKTKISSEHPYKMILLENGTLDTDLCIQLQFDTLKVERFGSEIGLQLKLALGELGLVSHKIWIEKQSLPIIVDENK
jgi:hypothetical protein